MWKKCWERIKWKPSPGLEVKYPKLKSNLIISSQISPLCYSTLGILMIYLNCMKKYQKLLLNWSFVTGYKMQSNRPKILNPRLMSPWNVSQDKKSIKIIRLTPLWRFMSNMSKNNRSVLNLGDLRGVLRFKKQDVYLNSYQPLPQHQSLARLNITILVNKTKIYNQPGEGMEMRLSLIISNTVGG